MRNRFMIYRKGHSVASALLFVLLIAHLLLPLLAWLGSAAGFPLGNLFSSEGIRWYYLHIQDCYRSPFMTVVFPVVLVLGAIERSGLSEIIEDSVSKGHQVVLLGIAYPVIIIQILSAAGRVNALHGGTVGLYQVLVLAAKTYPTERPVAVIEEFRPHNVFYVAGKDETVLVAAVARYFGNAGIINGFHERVAVIEEVRAPADKLFYGKEVALQRSIHLTAEFGRILMQHPGTLLEGQSHGCRKQVSRRK